MTFSRFLCKRPADLVNPPRMACLFLVMYETVMLNRDTPRIFEAYQDDVNTNLLIARQIPTAIKLASIQLDMGITKSFVLLSDSPRSV